MLRGFRRCLCFVSSASTFKVLGFREAPSPSEPHRAGRCKACPGRRSVCGAGPVAELLEGSQAERTAEADVAGLLR